MQIKNPSTLYLIGVLAPFFCSSKSTANAISTISSFITFIICLVGTSTTALILSFINLYSFQCVMSFPVGNPFAPRVTQNYLWSRCLNYFYSRSLLFFIATIGPFDLSPLQRHGISFFQVTTLAGAPSDRTSCCHTWPGSSLSRLSVEVTGLFLEQRWVVLRKNWSNLMSRMRVVSSFLGLKTTGR